MKCLDKEMLQLKQIHYFLLISIHLVTKGSGQKIVYQIQKVIKIKMALRKSIFVMAFTLIHSLIVCSESSRTCYSGRIPPSSIQYHRNLSSVFIIAIATSRFKEYCTCIHTLILITKLLVK